MFTTNASRSQARQRAFSACTPRRRAFRKVSESIVRVLARNSSFVRVKGFRPLLWKGCEGTRFLSTSSPRFYFGGLVRPQVSAEADFLGFARRSVVGLAPQNGNFFSLYPSISPKTENMKVRASVKRLCEACRIVKRQNVVRVICKNARHKQRQG